MPFASITTGQYSRMLKFCPVEIFKTTSMTLFRVENGFIAEHWDVMETLADKDTWQNPNGKF